MSYRHQVPTRVATFGALGHCYRLWVCQGMAGKGWKMIRIQHAVLVSRPQTLNFRVRSWQVQDEIEFVCGDPRYQSPETLRALIAHLKGNETASLDRILDLQTAKLGKKIRKSNICRKDFFRFRFWRGEIGFAADIWSLGVTLFELLSGGAVKSFSTNLLACQFVVTFAAPCRCHSLHLWSSAQREWSNSRPEKMGDSQEGSHERGPREVLFLWRRKTNFSTCFAKP